MFFVSKNMTCINTKYIEKSYRKKKRVIIKKFTSTIYNTSNNKYN